MIIIKLFVFWPGSFSRMRLQSGYRNNVAGSAKQQLGPVLDQFEVDLTMSSSRMVHFITGGRPPNQVASDRRFPVNFPGPCGPP